MTSRISYPSFTLKYEREDIPVHTLSPSKIPDEEWRYIDKAGHGHFWKGKKLPTLKEVVTGTTWVGDEYESHEVELTEHRCLLCDEVIKPGMRSEYGPSHVPGIATYTVTIGHSEFILGEEDWYDALDHLRKYLENGRYDS